MRLKTTNKAFTASKKTMFRRMMESVRLARCAASIARDVAQSQIAAMHALFASFSAAQKNVGSWLNGGSDQTALDTSKNE